MISPKEMDEDSKGYLIALVRVDNLIRIYGSSTDRNECDEILEINGRSFFGKPVEHLDIVDHIRECIKLRNIRVRIKRSSVKLTDAKNPSLLDVFVIGSDAHHQLEKFLEITKILPNQSELLKLTDNMELRELNNANQPVINGNGPYNMGQQPIMDCPQSPTGQMNIGQSHLYRGQQHQPPHRYVNNSKMSKHRELPVDVPDSFVGVAKQSPRYPPPKPHRQVSPPMPVNNLTTFSHVTPQPIPYNSNLPALPSVAQSTAANIMTHNSSLRNSVKLKQLEKTRSDQQRNNYPTNQMQPAINQAFELNEDDDGSTPMNGTNHQARTVANHSQQAQKPSKQPMPDLCSIYNRLQRNLNGEFADVTRDAKLAKLLSIYNTIIDTHDKQFKIPLLSSRLNSGPIDAQGNQEPLIFKVSDLLYSVIQILRQDDMTNEVAELLSILCKHEIDGVCSAFDRITQLFEFAKSSRPPSPKQVIPSENGIQPPTMFVSHHRPLDGINQNNGHQMDDFEYIHDHVQMDIENNLYHNSMNLMTDIDLSGGICTKTVRIDKSSHQALGATIKNDEGSDRVVIGRIVCGGAAHRSGLLNEGDEILEVNGIPMRGKKVDDVVDIIDNMEGTLTFTLVSPCYNKPMQHKLSETLFVRAFFDFDADKDEFIPCRELGLSFKKGEILAIIDNSDPLWLQAHREGDSEHRLAGIIPSLEQLKQRSSIHDDIPSYHKLKHERKNIVSKLFNCPKGSSPKRKRPNMPFGPENPFYEEVYLYYPDNYRKRPIILVGPKMIGQREIVAKLLQDPNRFACAISHTSRPMQGHERNGVDFHFVTRAQFEADIKNDKFIECGQYQNQYYGTSIEAMKEVVKSKKTCIQLGNTPSIFKFRNIRAGSELKPLFVFVKPDDSHPDKLRNIVASFSQPKSNIEDNVKAIMAEVQLIETHYLPYFDLTICVSDVDRAYEQLLCEIDRFEKEPQWIPNCWREAHVN